MLYRKKEKEIVEWLENSNKALLVTGARQVGKTYLIEKTLEKKQVDYISFNLVENPQIVQILKAVEGTGINNFIAQLSLLTDKPLTKGKTVIFFDEIQEYKEILTLIKFLVLDGSFKYVFSGSLLGVELIDLRSAPVGFLQTIEMYPMDFEEFAIALNLRKETINLLKDCFDNCKPVDDFIHQKMVETFYRYLVVGGMPEAVNVFLKENDFNKVSLVHNSIIPQYKKDFSKYEEINKKLKLHNIYDLIPSQLNDKNKRFVFTELDKNHRPEKYENSFEWLIHAGVAIPIYNVVEPKIPLKLNMKSNLFKLFLSDIGMLTTMFGKSCAIKILSNDKDINCGAIFENVVAQELLSHGYKGFYFNSKKQGELDFLIEYKGECVPIEVKSGKDYTIHSALNNVLANKDYGINKAFVLSTANVSTKGKIIYLPIYMIMFINEEDVILPSNELFDLSNL